MAILTDNGYTRKWILGIVAALSLLSLPTNVAAKKKKTQSRDIKSVRTEQTATQKRIRETSQKLEVNTKETKQRLQEYNTLTVELEDKRKEISSLQQQADQLVAEIQKKQDSINENNRKLTILKNNYINTLRRVQESPASMGMMSFIFSSENFNEAWRRLRYLNQFTEWRNLKSAEITQATEQLDRQKNSLSTTHAQHTRMLSQVNVARKELEVKQQKTDQVVKSLRQEESSLRKVLKEDEAKAKKLDAELDRLIIEEQRRQERLAKERAAKEAKERAEREKKEKARTRQGGTKPNETRQKLDRPAPQKRTNEPPVSHADNDRKLSGSFKSNKGRLLFPVNGKYRIVRGFGVQKHPELSHVETNNNGIDIEVSPNTKARAIFDGTVSAIFVQPGYNTIVMLRHGSYISIYAGLTGVAVRKGEQVKAGQTLGSVASEVENDNRAVLHFEIRREREKLNPLIWVRR